MTDLGDEHRNADDSLFDYDAELRRYHERLRAAIDVGAGDRALDIGCGTGQTTREVARAAVSGSALGVDLSARMLVRARRLSAVEGHRNVTFEQADAQVHPFPPAHFTFGISRFGTMFFADPAAAFTNIGRALRPGARFVQLVWQDQDQQEWDAAICQAFADEGAVPATTGGDAFSLADPDLVEGILTTTGFTEVEITDVREPIYYGPDTQAACHASLRLQMTKDLFAELDAARAERALERLHTILSPYDTGNGVWFDSRAWLITARRA